MTVPRGPIILSALRIMRQALPPALEGPVLAFRVMSRSPLSRTGRTANKRPVTQVVSPIVAGISRAVLAAATCTSGRGSLSEGNVQMLRKTQSGATKSYP
jgi:hypothetical protein